MSTIIQNAKVEAWLQSGKYLPPPMRDFHDQKDLFKAIDEMIKEDPSAIVKRPDWVSAQCYVIDTFLWWMARRGYTLQKSKQKFEFRDLEADVAMKAKQRSDAFADIINSGFSKP